jgi:hypothetical protein
MLDGFRALKSEPKRIRGKDQKEAAAAALVALKNSSANPNS